MDEYLNQLLSNTILVISLTSWFVAQVLKVLFSLITNRKFDLERLVGAGGMPSSHSALVVSLCISLAIYEGMDSSLFALSVIFASVVMYDAAGIRRAAGTQAKFLNELIQEFMAGHPFNDRKFKELLGHTPLEVFAGAALGAFISYIFYLWY